MAYSPGGLYKGTFITQRIDTGNATNADLLPTAVAKKGGVIDASFPITITLQSTGEYIATGTIPTTYVKGDAVQIVVSATVGGVNGKQVISDFIIDSANTYGQVFP